MENPDERFGEQLTRALELHSGQRWESINISHGDRQTLEEIQMLGDGLVYRPAIVILIYVFNDMDYLAKRFSFPPPDRPVVFDAPHGSVARLHPLRLAFWNSFLFQELYARARLVNVQFYGGRNSDPFARYRDTAAVRTHLADIARFVSTARASGAAVAIVPFDPTTAADSLARDRYSRFVNALRSAEFPVWSLEGLFDGKNLSEVTVNRLDPHPNGYANRLAVERVLPQALKLASDVATQP